MSNSYFTQRGIQASGFVIMVGMYSLDSQHCRPVRHPANVGCSLFSSTNGDLRNHINQWPKRKVWTREVNQFALHCYFRSNNTQRGYRKRMMEIWIEISNFQTTSQRLTDQAVTIRKKGWFYNHKIQEIHEKINDQQGNNKTLPGTSNINKQMKPNPKGTTNLEKWKPHTTKHCKPKKNRTITITRTKSISGKFKENYKQWIMNTLKF